MLGRERNISFDKVERVDSSYHSMGTSWSWFQRTDSVESFRISLSLFGVGEIIPVCVFRGEGAHMTGWSGVMWGDDVVDYEGNQEDLAHAFVSRLETLIFTPAKSLPSAPAPGARKRYSCSACGQGAAPGQTVCAYCGGGVESQG